MTSRKHERDLARARARRREVRDERARRRRVIALITVGALAVIAVGSAVAALIGLGISGSASDGSQVTAAAESPTPSPAADPVEPSPSAAAADPAADTAVGQPVAGCSPPGSFRGPGATFSVAPTPPATPPALALWTLATNCGFILIELDAAAAPATTASLDFLSEQGYYDETFCHRLTTTGIFVLQCGDPTATGTGGPGYQLAEENLPAAGERNYPAGTVAMARTAQPGSTGSQFFLVYDDTTLNPDYTIVGRVVQGLETLQAIAAAGVEGGGTDGFPTQPVFITKARVGGTP